MTFFHRKINRVLFFLTLYLGVTGCTFTQVIYDNADWFLLVEINSQFDLTSEQEKFLKPRLKDWISQQKEVQTPKIISLLNQSAVISKQGLTPSNLAHLSEQIEQIKMFMIRTLAPNTALLIQMLTPMQFDHHSKKLEDSNEELANLVKDKEDFEENLQDYIDDRIDNLEEWFGPLTKEQESRIAQWLTRPRSHFVTSLEFRRSMQRIWLTQLKKIKARPELESFIIHWGKDKSGYMTVEEKNFQQQRRSNWQQFALTFDKSLSSKQRAFLKERIEYWQDFFLSNRPPNTGTASPSTRQ